MLCFCFSSRRRHTRCALVTGVQTCALPICFLKPPCPPSGEMQPAIFPAEIEQGVAVRFELRADDAADKDEMVARLVKRFALAFERHERTAEQRHAGLPRRPWLVGETVPAPGGEPVRGRSAERRVGKAGSQTW